MAWALMGAVVVITLVVLTAFRRLERERRAEAARTTALEVDDRQVQRVLADGRVESVGWDEIIEVEVITTKIGVHRDDGVLLVLAADEARGCLVPSRLAAQEGLIGRLSNLPGFDTRALVEAMERPPPSRTVCWRRRS